MKAFKIQYLFIYSISIFIISCTKDEITETRYDEYRYGYSTSITGFVKAYSEFDSLIHDNSNIVVSINGINQSQTVNTNGKYVLTGVKVDNYLINVNKPGYVSETTLYRVNTAEGNSPIYFDLNIRKPSSTTISGLNIGIYEGLTNSDPDYVAQLFGESVLEIIGQVASDTSENKRRGFIVFIDTVPNVSRDQYAIALNSIHSDYVYSNIEYPIYSNSPYSNYYNNYYELEKSIRSRIFEKYTNNSAYFVIPYSTLKNGLGFRSNSKLYFAVYGVSSSSKYNYSPFYYNYYSYNINETNGLRKYNYLNPEVSLFTVILP